jgi:hypothetical protein
MTIPGATAHATRNSNRGFIEGARAMAEAAKPKAQTKPRGLARHRAMLATTSNKVVFLGQASDPGECRPHAASDKTAAMTRPQVTSQPFGFTTIPMKTAVGVETSRRKVPHHGFRRRI